MSATPSSPIANVLSGVVREEKLTPVGPNIHANKMGYEEIADTVEAIVDPQ